MNQRQPLRIGYIFEGPTDKETIPDLVAQLLGQPIHVIPLRKQSSGWYDFRRPRPKDLRAGRHSPRWGMLKSYVESLLIKDAEAIVIVADQDEDDDIGHQDPFPHKRWCILGKNLPFVQKPQLRLIDRAELETSESRAELCDNCDLGPDCFPDCVAHDCDPGTVPVIVGIAKQMLEAWLLAQPDVVEAVLWEPLSNEDRKRCEDPESIRHPKKEVIRPYNGGVDLSQRQAELIGQNLDFSAEAIRDACQSFERFAQDVHVLLEMPE